MSLRNKSRPHKPVFRTAVMLVLIALLVVLGRAAFNMYNKYKVAGAVLGEKKMVYDNMLERSDYLTDELASLATPEGLEEELRQKLSVAKEGEKVIVLVDPDKGQKTIQPLSEKPSWTKRVLRFLNPFD